MICQPMTSSVDLPYLEPEDLHSVFQDIITRPVIYKNCIDILIKLMTAEKYLMQANVCNLVLKLCEDNDVKVITFSPGHSHKKGEEPVYSLSMDEKKGYVKIALD